MLQWATKRHVALEQHNLTSKTAAFVHHVVQTLAAIEFSMIWEEQGKKWKSASLAKLYHAEHGDADGLETWKLKFGKTTTARNKLAELYRKFGPHVLLDPQWSTHSLHPNHRSETYTAVTELRLFVDMPKEPEDNVPTVHSRFTVNALVTTAVLYAIDAELALQHLYSANGIRWQLHSPKCLRKSSCGLSDERDGSALQSLADVSMEVHGRHERHLCATVVSRIAPARRQLNPLVASRLLYQQAIFVCRMYAPADGITRLMRCAVRLYLGEVLIQLCVGQARQLLTTFVLVCLGETPNKAASALVDNIDLLANSKHLDEVSYRQTWRDGRVAATLFWQGTRYLITTNEHYVPELSTHSLSFTGGLQLQMRKDLCWGADDPTIWPQECIDNFLHLPSIPRSARYPSEAVMFWNPDPSDLVHHDTQTSVVRGKGYLHQNPSSKLSLCANALLDEAKTLEATYVKKQKPPLLGILRLYLGDAVERLTGLHDNWDLYQRRLHDPDAYHPIPDDCVGAFTSSAKQAQHLFRAGIPFWYMRELTKFQDECIFKVVEPSRIAECLEVEPHPSFPPTPTIYTWDAHLEIHRAAFNTQTHTMGPSQNPPVSYHALTGPPNHARQKQRQERSKPLTRRPKTVTSATSLCGVIAPAAWELALRMVDRTKLPDQRLAQLYALPEPGLVVSSSDDARVNQMLHHLNRFYDALVHRMKAPTKVTGVSGQQWRELLYGNTLKPPGRGKLTKSQKITASIAPVFDSLFTACGTDLTGLPIRKEDARSMATSQAQELTWLLAKGNFRDELLTLDREISCGHIESNCKACFTGCLFNPPLSESKRGLAATDPQERLPHLLSFVTIMKKWRRPCPPVIAQAHETTTWSTSKIEELEQQVARHYTQSFYDQFGRAAVVPLRLQHDVTPDEAVGTGMGDREEGQIGDVAMAVDVGDTTQARDSETAQAQDAKPPDNLGVDDDDDDMALPDPPHNPQASVDWRQPPPVAAINTGIRWTDWEYDDEDREFVSITRDTAKRLPDSIQTWYCRHYCRRLHIQDHLPPPDIWDVKNFGCPTPEGEFKTALSTVPTLSRSEWMYIEEKPSRAFLAGSMAKLPSRP
ncbi:hypothetical protein GGX14DRAFT_592631 [Mycena pura]|uniref:Uncharacterized protein n=1 Tax=Mycena pura TaxID=153505 RepID=A0AAD6VWF6_9AGAR|nr:hypothetical protein GGX14DRAFT_592631 [Mycena pura]